MDMNLAGLAYVFSPAARTLITGPENEDAFYAAYDRWTMPAWVTGLAAIVRRLHRRPAETPASNLARRVA
ncbi:MAG: hypothetical protein EOP19_17055 [Hyphomicrobiales bacterium]|nr:MAG: hypothetical protein EOP19_17055 [Hyphomicrobiales bacterium]